MYLAFSGGGVKPIICTMPSHHVAPHALALGAGLGNITWGADRGADSPYLCITLSHVDAAIRARKVAGKFAGRDLVVAP